MRKTLKQKLRKQARDAKADKQHMGFVLNYETQAMQSIALAHGVMATMLAAKILLGEEDANFLKLQEQSQARIAQCYLALVEMGFSHEEANARILQGH